MISEQDINNLLDRADITQVVGHYVSDFKLKGDGGMCCCPFHAEKTPSFRARRTNNLWYCYGCHEGGNALQFVQKIEGCTFREAVFKLAGLCGVQIEDKPEELTKEEREARIKRQTMLAINEMVCDFYAGLLWEENQDAAAARLYIAGREWPEDYARETKMGFAPRSGNPLLAFARKNQLSLPLMEEMGLLKTSDSGKMYDFYRDRVLFPIRSRSNQVIGFSARIINEQYYKDLLAQGKIDRVPPKYINSKESAVYDKSTSIFGIEKAAKMGASKKLFYLVEGGPDVLRLQSLGIDNTIASLGGKWTEAQLTFLRGYQAKLCFITDCDPVKGDETYGAGTKNVMENGAAAIRLGLGVTVKEIRPEEDGKKSDPDSYITNKHILDSIEEEDFILWYAGKKFAVTRTMAERSELIEEIAELIACMKNQTSASVTETALGKKYGFKKEWKKAIEEVRKKKKEDSKRKRCKSIDRDTLSKYGFYEDSNCYYSVGAGGADLQWSNFTLHPLFHIEDAISPKRLFSIRNISGTEKLVELRQPEITSVGKFTEKIEGLGNFIWLAKQEQLNKLKMWLYDQTETATEITQLGWQRKGFWAFGNGVYANGEWVEADDLGIVRLEGLGNFYLPACSKIYETDSMLFQFERRFVHTNFSGITLRSYAEQLIQVFGDNAKVGMCFLLATLFKDVIVAETTNFPILNLFGQKGSGKSEMGHSFMAFFIHDNKPANLQNGTDASLADAVNQCANALVHLDEYKNTIDLTRREFLKGIYDGVGRSRLNMDRDKKREMTKVDCGVILSGQEMPTIDNALFSRLIYLTFNRTDFNPEERRCFQELAKVRSMGCTHLTLEILSHRKKFEADFPANYNIVFSDVQAALSKEIIEDRILRNWTSILAAFRSLSGVLDLPFDYKEMLSVCIEGIVRQNAECKSKNELSQFWGAVEVMHQLGLAISNADFRIIYETSLSTKVKGRTVTQEWITPKPILYINFKVLLSSYQKYAKNQGDTVVPENTLRNYMECSPEFYGLKTAMRFQMPLNTHDGVRRVERADGTMALEKVSKNFQAYCFDYAKVSERYGINLEVMSSAEELGNPTSQELPF